MTYRSLIEGSSLGRSATQIGDDRIIGPDMSACGKLGLTLWASNPNGYRGHADKLLEMVGLGVPPLRPLPGSLHLGAWRAYYKALVEAGVYVAGDALEVPETGTTVCLREGKRRVQDGPYADTKEQLAGFISSTDDEVESENSQGGYTHAA